MTRPNQPWFIRATHWANVVLLTIMAGSGLQIFAAYPTLGPRGDIYSFYPWQGHSPPALFTLGRWLAGARHFHFAFAWLFCANALFYAVFFFASGEWRRRLFWPPRDARNAWETVLHDLRLKKSPPPSVGLYNGMQRLAYTGILIVSPLLILSGLVLYKPVQLPHLLTVFFGYDPARVVHLAVLALLALFTVLHVVEVLLHPRTFVDMATGGRREEEASSP